MEDTNDIRKELDDIAPFLSSIPKKEILPFEVPVNYFEEFPNIMMEKIQQQTKVPKFGFDWRRIFAPKMALAFGAVAILLVAGLMVFNNYNQAQLTALTDDDVTNIEEALAEDVTAPAVTTNDDNTELEDYIFDASDAAKIYED
ncbi:MAG: hypothetical protein NTX03_14645 [Bacteroidetes bacterium]|nr:hypothetical protein [Bacteroidota bacterium]